MSKFTATIAILLAAGTAAAFADTINFESQCPSGQQTNGPCSSLFSTVGNAETLLIPTSIGTVTVSGGALFDDIANLPADETAVYGTAGNASNIGVTTGTGFTNPITITFPVALTSFEVDVLNGNTTSVEYEIADNQGNDSTSLLAANFSGGLQSISFNSTGTVVTIDATTGQSTPSGMTWDFLIDDINFTTASTTTSTPEPASYLLLGAGLMALGLRRRRAKFIVALLVALPLVPFVSAATTSPGASISLACPSGNGAAGVAYASALTASGGVPPYTISISSGGLPAGLSLNASTGAITGTPSSAGAFPFTGKVVDSLVVGAGGSPDSSTVSCSIVIAGPPVITNLTPYMAVSGGPSFAMTLVGSGYVPASTVMWNGAALATQYVNSTQLTAQVPANLISKPQFATVTVSNSGLVSNEATFSVEETWVQVTDQYAVTFGQVTPDNSNLVVDWQTGLATADFTELSKDGINGGYIQVLEFDSTNPQDDGAWVVQNLPVEGPQFLAGNDRPFGFAAQVGGPLATTNVAVYHTNFEAAPPRPVVKPAPGNQQQMPFRPNVAPAPARPQATPVRPIPANIGGLIPPQITNPPTSDDVKPLDPDQKRTDFVDSLTDSNSVEQQRNECAPSSVANSMQYLGVADRAQNVPAGRAGSRVGLLDAQMGYNINLGTSALGILNGKARYIAGANPTGRPLAITMNSQGRFCPTGSIDPNCPLGQNGDSGAAPTEKFITDALTAKKDVEVCFAWAAYPGAIGPPRVPPSPAGAHCVFVTGYRWINGYLTLDATQDLNQGAAGGVDWEDGGHISMRIGTANNQLWIRSFFGRPALVTQVITEANN